MKFEIFFTTIILLGWVSNQHIAFGNNNEDNWIEPDAWARDQYAEGRHSYEQDAKYSTANQKSLIAANAELPGAVHSDETMALKYFKKFIAHLFNGNELKYNAKTAEYHRALLFTVLPAQLEKLNKLNDPRDLDAVLTEILLRARKPSKYDMDESGNYGRGMGVLALIWDILKDLAQLLKTSEIQFLLVASIVILLGWYCHRRYGFGIIAMIVGAVALFGYFHTYLECNRKLEAERLLEIMAQNEIALQSQSSWFNAIRNYFATNEPRKKSEQDYIRKSSKLNLTFCRPDHVFLLYVNDLFLTQLQFLLDKCVTTLETLKSSLSFPYNYIASFMLVALIAYIVKLTFKYVLSPRVWIGAFQARTTIAHDKALPATGTAHHEDRVSGENLRMLLNAISGRMYNSESTKAIDAAVTSGVQEVLEPLEAGDAATAETTAGPSTTDNSLSTDSVQQLQNNNNESNAQQSAGSDAKEPLKEETELKATT